MPFVREDGVWRLDESVVDTGLGETMTRSLALLLLLFLGSVIGACGQARKGTTAYKLASPNLSPTSHNPSATSGNSNSTNAGAGRDFPARPRGDEDDDDEDHESVATALDGDDDRDNDAANLVHTGYYDRDDGVVRDFGHPAGTPEKHTISELVRGYFSAAASDQGQAGCALLTILRAESLPEDFGRAYLPGATTCAQVLTEVFKRLHSRFPATVEVVGVRVQGVQGQVLLRSSAIPASVIGIRRQRGVWRMDSVFAFPLP